MKKRIFKLLVLFVLLFSVGISKVSAWGTFYRYGKSWASNTTSAMIKKGMITYDWYTGSGKGLLCANGYQGACKKQKDWWNTYWVKTSTGKYYITYCVNPYLSLKNDYTVNEYGSIDNMKFSESSLSAEEKARRIAMMKQLLMFGINIDPTNKHSMKYMIDSVDKNNYLKHIAMQILVWEVWSGGRTSFDTIEPQWNGDSTYKSFYNYVIYPNGGDNPTKENTLYWYYTQTLKQVNDAYKVIDAPAFDEDTYTLAWDSVNKKYKVTVTGLGEYGKEDEKCTVDNKNVTLSAVNNGSITISATDTIKTATITCKYARGNSESATAGTKELFRHFKFKNHHDDWQDMLYGSGYTVYEKSFKVTTENTNLSIKKVDSESKAVSGAKFTLTHMTNQSISVEIDGNGSAENLIMSGKYRVSETTVPTGYDRISDFNITINAKTHKITDCESKQTDETGAVVSCLNNQVKVKYTNGEIELSIVNLPKNFKIVKVNQSGNVLMGAAFEIRDSKDNLVKFTYSGSVFKYDTAGTVTSLNMPTLSAYPIALLPEGEYKIIEIAAPPYYRLPKDVEMRTTKIKVNANREVLVYDRTKNTYVAAASGVVRVLNYGTTVNINKTGHGMPLEGVQFELYNEDKSVKIKSSLGFPGKYTYVDEQDTVENYIYVTNAKGEITIDNLPEGTYYFKEIATVEPFVLPAGDAVYTKVVIAIDENGVSINGSHTLNTIEISNSPNMFNFYKRDTEGNALTTGKYKLQKYDNETKKYVDLKLVEVPNDGTYSPNTDIYRVDEKNGKIQFILSKGMATFIDMESSSTYRIVETVAPEGYTKADAKDTATVYIDEYGNASGMLVLIDQKIAGEDASAFAELIVNIQTGKQRIMYAAVIVIVISIIAGLIIFNRKKEK